MRYLLFFSTALLLSSCATVHIGGTGSNTWGRGWGSNNIENVVVNRTIEPVEDYGLTRFRVTLDVATEKPIDNISAVELMPPGARVVKHGKGNCSFTRYARELHLNWSTLPPDTSRVSYIIEVRYDRNRERSIHGRIGPSERPWNNLAASDKRSRASKRAARRAMRNGRTRELNKRQLSFRTSNTIATEVTDIVPIRGVRMVSTHSPAKSISNR